MSEISLVMRFDLLALAADDEAGAGGVERDAHAVPGALDDDRERPAFWSLFLR